MSSSCHFLLNVAKTKKKKTKMGKFALSRNREMFNSPFAKATMMGKNTSLNIYSMGLSEFLALLCFLFSLPTVEKSTCGAISSCATDAAQTSEEMRETWWQAAWIAGWQNLIKRRSFLQALLCAHLKPCDWVFLVAKKTTKWLFLSADVWLPTAELFSDFQNERNTGRSNARS